MFRGKLLTGGKLRASSDKPIAVHAEAYKPFKREPKPPVVHPYYWAPIVLIGNWQ